MPRNRACSRLLTNPCNLGLTVSRTGSSGMRPCCVSTHGRPCCNAPLSFLRCFLSPFSFAAVQKLCIFAARLVDGTSCNTKLTNLWETAVSLSCFFLHCYWPVVSRRGCLPLADGVPPNVFHGYSLMTETICTSTSYWNLC